ncbi:MAG: iron-containing alcohol dehydrogenase [Dehalococcoidales bacterium]|nr:iron-containing alcohol dehydrogenase [Dehalococcoidales bacterium]
MREEFNINFGTPVLFGVDTSLKTGEQLKMMGATKALFVYDQGIKKAGIPDKIIEAVKAAGIEVAVYEDVKADPPISTLEQGAEIGRKAGSDSVVAIGGGSSMDTAKGIALLLTNPSPLKQYMAPGGPRPKPYATLITIPTTSGTGSEVTQVAVLTDDETHKKGGIGGIRANLAIVDPVLAKGMPPVITADTGLDALVHAIESVTANMATMMSEIVGERAISLIWEYLPKAVKDGNDIEARSKMSFAAMIAGFGFDNSMTHLPHSVGHTLGSLFHIPHGNACGIILPEAIEWISETVPDQVKKVGKAMGLAITEATTGLEAGKMISKALLDFYGVIGQKTLKDHNITEEDLPAIAEMATTDVTYPFCPRKAEKEDILEMLKIAYQR